MTEMPEINLLITILIWLLIAGVLIWAIRAISASMNLPPVVSIIGQVIVALVLLVGLLRLVGYA